jgi:hypothetical protein
MRIKVAVPEENVDPTVINAALEAVTALDESMIRQGTSPTADALIADGAVWRPEPPGDECFDHGGTIAARGWGDCDDWAPLGAATLRTSGEDPGAKAVVIPSGPMTYHAVVQRSDGTLEDPSVAAGMKPLGSTGIQGGRVVSGADDGSMQVYACDPHDGRIYTGALLPTTAPLSLHCGVGIAIRGIVTPQGPYFEARADVPIAGRLVHVRSYARRAPRHHRGGKGVRGGHGYVPYSIACIGSGPTAQHALVSALSGAVLCGDAMGQGLTIDRYKSLALAAGTQGLTPGQTRELLREQMTADLLAASAQSGNLPTAHSRALVSELEATGMRVQGPTTWVVGDFFSDVANIASGVVSSVSSAVTTVAKAAGGLPWGDIIHDAEAVVSAVPGIGTAVSDVVAAAETAYDSAADLMGGHPIDAAIDAAYNFAMASVPGAASMRPMLDPVVSTLKHLADGGEPPVSDALQAILSAVPTSPSFGPLNPQSVASSIAKLITSHLGVDNSKSGSSAQKSSPAPLSAAKATQVFRAQSAAMSSRIAPPGTPRAPLRAPAVQNPVARQVLALKPPGVAHAGVHIGQPLLQPVVSGWL